MKCDIVDSVIVSLNKESDPLFMFADISASEQKAAWMQKGICRNAVCEDSRGCVT